MKISRMLFWGTAGALLAFMLLAPPARAEEGKKPLKLETVTVSAQKREENIQKVPMSVGVVSEIQLEDSRTNDLTQLGKNIPNLYISSAGSAGAYTFLGVRGRINSTLDVDPTVTVLVDGVPYDDFFSVGNNLLFDVERVEVLRGSQSTIYGMNSASGVINVVTREPGQTMRASAYGEGGWGPTWDGSFRLGASLSGPISKDILSGGLAVATQGQGGYVKNINDGDRFNADRNIAARGNLVWTPTDKLKIIPGLSYSKLSADNGLLRLPFNSDSARRIGQPNKSWKTNVDWEGNTDVETFAPNLKVNYNADTIDIISVTTFRNTDQEFDFDTDLTPAKGGPSFPNPKGFTRFENEQSSLTQEFRVQSTDAADSPLEWMGGYFFNTFDRRHAMRLGDSNTHAVVMSLYDADFTGYGNAFFGQATYRALDKKLGFTLGLRQEWTSREAKSRIGAYDKTTKHDSQFLPKFAIDYRYTPDIMFYASVTQGWRSGGVNPFNGGANLKYDKEISWTYEVGTKTQWSNNTQLNLSAFYTDYEDFQDRNRLGFLSWLGNIPKVRMMGLEAEMNTQLTDSLQLQGFLGYVNAKYVDSPDPIAGDFDGNTVVSTPDFNANLALKYTFLKHYYVRPSIQGIGTIYWNRENTVRQDPYMTVNLKAGYAKDNYEMYVYGENLTNEYAFSEVTDDPIVGGAFTGTPIRPMQMGVGASIRF